MILLINSSPKPQGNLHRILEKIARDSGAEYEMIHLAKLRINPCIGCVKCADTNRCVQNDGMAPLYDKILKADAIVVGSTVHFGYPNAFTYTFMERLFPLRHVRMLTKSKLAAVVSIGGNEAEQCACYISDRLKRYFDYNIVGSVSFNSASPPCLMCGYGTICRYGGPATWMSPEEFENFNEITPEMFQKFEDHPEVVMACEALSAALKTGIASLLQTG